MTASAIRGQYKVVSVKEIFPDPRNANRESQFVFKKLLKSIQTFGFTDPLIVRTHAKGYMVVGGAHRLEAAKQLSMEKVPIIDLGKMTDNEAHRLLIVLNETKGSPDQDALAALVQSIHEDGGSEALEVLPYSDAQLAELLDDVDEPAGVDDDDMTDLPVDKPAKIGPKDIGNSFELEGCTQKDFARILEAIRVWRSKQNPEKPAWRSLIDTLGK